MALFGQKQPPKEDLMEEAEGGKKNNNAPQQAVPDFIKILSELNRRLRLLEERVNGVYEKVRVFDNTLSSTTKNIEDDIKEQGERISKVEEDIKNIKIAIQELANQTKSFATRRDVKVLERSMEILSPIKYLTEDKIKKEGE